MGNYLRFVTLLSTEAFKTFKHLNLITIVKVLIIFLFYLIKYFKVKPLFKATYLLKSIKMK